MADISVIVPENITAPLDICTILNGEIERDIFLTLSTEDVSATSTLGSFSISYTT